MNNVTVGYAHPFAFVSEVTKRTFNNFFISVYSKCCGANKILFHIVHCFILDLNQSVAARSIELCE